MYDRFSKPFFFELTLKSNLIIIENNLKLLFSLVHHIKLFDLVPKSKSRNIQTLNINMTSIEGYYIQWDRLEMSLCNGTILNAITHVILVGVRINH